MIRATLAVLLGLTGAVHAAGLPLPAMDAYGYTAGTIPYSYTDISGSGTLVTGWSPSADDGAVLLNLPYNFRFYGAPFNKVGISSNGYLEFGSTSAFYALNCLGANQDPRSAVALYWMDLDPGAGGAVYTQIIGSAGSRVVIVQYQAVPPRVGGGFFSGQARLYEADNSIELAWAVVSSTNNGGDAVTGIRSAFDCPNRTSLPLSCTQALLSDGSAVRFSYPGTEPACGTPTITPTFTVSQTFTISPTWSPSPTITETFSQSATPSISPTWSPSPSVTPSFSHSPTGTPTLTPVDTPTITVTSTATPTPSPTRTVVVLTDAFGYVAVQAPLVWDEISGTGQPVTAWAGGPDDGSAVIDFPVGWSFRFYGADYTKVSVSSNGYLQFGSSSSAFGHTCLNAASSPFGLAALYWMDLDPSLGGNVYWEVLGSSPNRRLVIEFSGVSDSAATGTLTAEAVLHEGSHAIELRYLSSSALGSGNAASAGLRSLFDCPNRGGLSLSCDTPGLGDGTAWSISYPGLEPACGTPTSTPSPTRSPSPTQTGSASPTVTATPTASPSWTVSPTITATPSISPSWTASPTVTATPSITQTPTISPTWTDSPTVTTTPTITETATISPTWTDSPTSTDTLTITETATISPTFSASPTATPTGTISPTYSISPTFSDSPTATPSATISPSWTASPTVTFTPSATPTATRSATATASPSATPTRTVTLTITLTFTTIPTLLASPCAAWAQDQSQLPMNLPFDLARHPVGVALAGQLAPGPSYGAAGASVLALVDPGGGLVWSRTDDNAGADAYTALHPDGSGGLSVGGEAGGARGLRFDATGNSIFAYAHPSAVSATASGRGPGGLSYLLSLDRAPGGPPFGIASQDIHVTALSAAGFPQWDQVINVGAFDEAHDLTATASGLLYVPASHGAWLTGSAQGSLRQFDINGIQNWSLSFGGAWRHVPEAVALNGTGVDVLVSFQGTTGSARYFSLQSFNNAGTLMVSRPLACQDYLRMTSLELRADGSYLIAGWKDAATAFAAKIAPTGVKLWQVERTVGPLSDAPARLPRATGVGANEVLFLAAAYDSAGALSTSARLELLADGCLLPTPSSTRTVSPTATPTRTGTPSITPSFSASPTLAPAAGKPACAVLGQTDFTSSAQFSGGADKLKEPAGVAIDAFSSPMRLYVADALNHRIVGWSDISALANGQPADIVIGQPDLAQFGAGSGAGGLNGPAGVAVNPSNGDVWVADSGNHRVLRFNAPIPAAGATASQVLGQPSLSGTAPNNPSVALGLNRPSGLAFDASGRLAVADSDNHRVLIYVVPAAATAPDAVLGQNGDFSTNAVNHGASTDASGFNGPQKVLWGLDSLYVSDTLNNRVLRFSMQPALSSSADRVYGQTGFNGNAINQGLAFPNENCLNQPQGLALDGGGRLLVADRGNDRVVGYEPYDAQGDLVWGQPNLGFHNVGTGPDTVNQPVDVSAIGSLLAVADKLNNRILLYGCGGAILVASPTPTPTATASVTSTFSATPSVTATPTITLSGTISPSWTPSESHTVTPSVTSTTTRTTTPTRTLTPSITLTFSRTSTSTATPSVTPLATATITQTAQPSQTPYPTTGGDIITWPNPAPRLGGRACIGFAPGASVVVELYDRLAQPVVVLSSAQVSAAAGFACWDLRNRAGDLVAPGLYYARVVVDGQARIGRLTVR